MVFFAAAIRRERSHPHETEHWVKQSDTAVCERGAYLELHGKDERTCGGPNRNSEPTASCINAPGHDEGCISYSSPFGSFKSGAIHAALNSEPRQEIQTLFLWIQAEEVFGEGRGRTSSCAVLSSPGSD